MAGEAIAIFDIFAINPGEIAILAFIVTSQSTPREVRPSVDVDGFAGIEHLVRESSWFGSPDYRLLPLTICFIAVTVGQTMESVPVNRAFPPPLGRQSAWEALYARSIGSPASSTSSQNRPSEPMRIVLTQRIPSDRAAHFAAAVRGHSNFQAVRPRSSPITQSLG